MIACTCIALNRPSSPPTPPLRLRRYDEKRNDPTVPDALSGLSPYLHFGQLAPQRAAIEAAKCKSVHKVGVLVYTRE